MIRQTRSQILIHEIKILTEEDEKKRAGYIALLKLTKEVLETCIDLLGFEAPERM